MNLSTLQLLIINYSCMKNTGIPSDKISQLASNSSKNSEDASNSFCLFQLLCKPSCLSSLINQSWSKNSKNEKSFWKAVTTWTFTHFSYSRRRISTIAILIFFLRELSVKFQTSNADYHLSNSLSNIWNLVILSY